MRRIYLAVTGASFLWAIAVVLLIFGRYTPFPMFDFVRSTVFLGAIIWTVLGIGMLIRNGYQRLSD
ncbi:hypothetical protein DV706_18620 (plasmid) [Natronorubrum bangense]|uniref:Uncharacterized protein n=1 Tax=Natronorubrum bangense TaxID=61858 RepID=A0A4D6HTT1_9EURY|nr:hypothetical protein DV706_18620 [Natronorubrum bangense]